MLLAGQSAAVPTAAMSGAAAAFLLITLPEPHFLIPFSH